MWLPDSNQMESLAGYLDWDLDGIQEIKGGNESWFPGGDEKTAPTSKGTAECIDSPRNDGGYFSFFNQMADRSFHFEMVIIGPDFSSA